MASPLDYYRLVGEFLDRYMPGKTPAVPPPHQSAPRRPVAAGGGRQLGRMPRRRRYPRDVAYAGHVAAAILAGGDDGGGGLGGSGGSGGGSNGGSHGGSLESTGGVQNVVVWRNSNFDDAFEVGSLNPWWTQARGAFTEGGGQCSATAVEAAGNPRSCLLYNALEFADGEAAIVIGSAAGEHLVGLRVTDSGGGTLSGYFARATTLSTVLYVVTANVATALTTIPTGYAIGDEMRIRATGTTLEVEKNGAGVISLIDATHAGPGFAGLGTFALSGRAFNSFSVRA
ncbi:MAG: hypothetical protein AMXMBFR77_28470 [Phycisphaerales bacterium]